MYIIFIIWIILWKREFIKDRSKENIKKILRDSIPFILGIILYMSIYICFYIRHPSVYAGNNLVIEEWGDIFKVIKTQFLIGYYSIPLSSHKDLSYLLMLYSDSNNEGGFSILNIDLIYYIQSLLLSLVSIYLLLKFKKIKQIYLFIGLIIGFLLYLLPSLPFSISSRYFDKGMNNYLTTFLSFFGVIVFISSLVFIILNLIQRYKGIKLIFIISLSSILFLISLKTNYVNGIIAKDFEATKFRFEVVKDVFKYDLIRDISSVPICLEELRFTKGREAHSVTAHRFTWGRYILKTAHKNTKVYDCYKDFYDTYKYSDTILRVGFFNQAIKTNDIILFIAELRGKELPPKARDIICDKIYIL